MKFLFYQKVDYKRQKMENLASPSFKSYLSYQLLIKTSLRDVYDLFFKYSCISKSKQKKNQFVSLNSTAASRLARLGNQSQGRIWCILSTNGALHKIKNNINIRFQNNSLLNCCWCKLFMLLA